MKLVMDERVKHRLVGIAVIISIGAIFVPAVMKQSNQRLTENISLSVKLPPKPAMPKVSAVPEKQLFKTVKVAHVEIPAVRDQAPPVLKIAKAEPLSPMSDAIQAKRMASNAPAPSRVEPIAKLEPIEKETVKALDLAMTEKANPVKLKAASKKSLPIKPVVAAKKPVKRIATKPAMNVYEVQLATFAKQSNATALVTTLKRRGYQASMKQVVDKKVGLVYKVMVGPAKQREKAKQLQRQLASTVQLNGFIVSKEIS